MSGKDVLSQEEIDALLRQGVAGKPAASKDIHDYLSPIGIDTLGEIGNISFGSASTALSSLLRQKVEITTPKVDLVLKDELSKEFPVPYVLVHVRYTEGLQGDNLLVLRIDDAKIIADLMLGGDGTSPKELGEIELSACGEAMNQMMGSAATSMSMIFNTPVNISPPAVKILDFASGEGVENIPDEEILIRISFNLKVGNLIDSTIMQIIPVSFAKEVVQILLGEQPGGGNEREQAIAQTAATAEREPAEQEMQGALPSSRPAVEAQSSLQQPRHDPQYFGGHGAASRKPNVQSVQFSSFESANPPSQANGVNLNLLLDIPLQVTVELGRTKKMIKEILELAPGSIIELDKLAGEPVDILVNNKLVAKGEVVVIEENFGVRVTEIISQWDRLQKLQ